MPIPNKETLPDDEVLRRIRGCKDFRAIRSLVPAKQAKRIHDQRDELSSEDRNWVDRFYGPYVMFPAIAEACERIKNTESPWNDRALLDLPMTI